MFIALLSVKQKIKSYLELHRFVKDHWDVMGGDLGYKVIPETTMRYRLKKSALRKGKTPGFVSSMFPEEFFNR
ncbi:MAG: hypothetical protein AB1397_06915 [bacterium]